MDAKLNGNTVCSHVTAWMSDLFVVNLVGTVHKTTLFHGHLIYMCKFVTTPYIGNKPHYFLVIWFICKLCNHTIYLERNHIIFWTCFLSPCIGLGGNVGLEPPFFCTINKFLETEIILLNVINYVFKFVNLDFTSNCNGAIFVCSKLLYSQKFSQTF